MKDLCIKPHDSLVGGSAWARMALRASCNFSYIPAPVRVMVPPPAFSATTHLAAGPSAELTENFEPCVVNPNLKKMPLKLIVGEI